MVVQQLDDRHSSITYSGVWERAGISPEFDNTTTWSNLTGSTATVVFYGTSISVWGTIGFSGLGIAPLSSYSIDHGPVSIFTAAQIPTTQYNQRFFQSDQLTPTSHTLNISTLANGGYFYLDYLLVVTPDSATSSTSTTIPTPSSPTTTSPTNTPQMPSSKRDLPIGVIVGGVSGAIALLALAIICILVIKRKMNQRHDRQTSKPEVTTSLWSKFPSTKTGGLTPFVTQPYRPLHNHNYGAEHQADYSSFISSPQLHDPFATSRSNVSTLTSQSASREHPSTDIPLAVRDRIPTSKAAALLQSQGSSSASPSTMPQDRYEGPPPNYNE
ncbi:hypothetical protein BJ912DRAFT_1068035 [Pholiota molesta]|nr:hypothetical protein BJ912DRAFT_1068035 [Pholiota molesta]